MSQSVGNSIALPQLLSRGPLPSAEAIEELLCDPQSLRVLIDLMEQRGDAYSESLRFVRGTPSASQLTVLLDFDVLCAYFEAESANRPDLLEIKYFFQVSTLNYKLPLGALEELFQYLKREGYLQDIDEAGRGKNPEEWVAHLLNNLYARAATSDATGSFDSLVDDEIIRISRLVEVFESSRYKGLATHYSQHAFNACYDMLLQHNPMRIRNERLKILHSEELSDINTRDAVNLAVALRPREKAEDADAKPLYILLSTTSAVHAVARQLYQESACGSSWIAIRPSQLALADLLHFTESPKLATASAKALSGMFRSLSSRLADHLDALPTLTTKLRLAQVKLLANRIATATRKLVNERDSLKIEEQRCAFLSVAASHRAQVTSGISNKGHIRYVSFLRAFESLHRVLNGLPGAAYFITRVDGLQGICHFLIKEKNGISDAPLCTLTKYPADCESRRPWKCTWTLELPVAEFVESLQGCFVNKLCEFATFENSNDATPMSPVSASVWRSGVAVVTAMASYGFPPAWIAGTGGLWFLEPSTLAKHIQRIDCETARSINSATAWRRMSAEGTFIPEIQEISVNTSTIDIIYDVVPRDGRFDRQLTLLFVQANVELCTELFDAIGPRRVERARFDATLRQCFKAMDHHQ